MKHPKDFRGQTRLATRVARSLAQPQGQAQADLWDIDQQRSVADVLVYELTGKKMSRSQMGRPRIGTSADVSLSHKNDFVAVATVPAPYRIGIDVEHLVTGLNAELFFGPAITSRELPFFKTFCEKNNFSYSSGVAVFWSIKESFFKCLDYDFKPAKISVRSISGKGKIRFDMSDEIKTLMEGRGLALCSSKTLLRGEHIFSQTVMRKM
ncbi:MAG: hypothetical protein WAV46_02095 [Candidatus Moraniibacteriota bacterium]